MSNRGLWLEGGTTFPNGFTRAIGVTLAVAWVLLIGARNPQFLFLAEKNPQHHFASRFECGSDPWDFLRIGELLEASSLLFIVEAHCANVRYVPGWIELRYGGGRIDIGVRPVSIGGTTYYEIVSIGGVAAQ